MIFLSFELAHGLLDLIEIPMDDEVKKTKCENIKNIKDI
jgi:uncharacterized protein (UPF0276 family)